mgnify:FL=1
MIFFIDKPYVSEYLKQTLSTHQVPVYDPENLLPGHTPSLTAEETRHAYQNPEYPPMVYTNSEISFSHIYDILSETPLPAQINEFKNKFRFRQLLADYYPRFHFEAYTTNELLQQIGRAHV